MTDFPNGPKSRQLNTHGHYHLMAPSYERAGTIGFRCAADAVQKGVTKADDEEGAPPRPHIVLVVVDDMGYRNINAPPLYDNPEIISPELARLAREGISLSNYYAYKFCTPSRESIMSGRVPGHGISEGLWSSAVPLGLNLNLTLVPAKLRAVGYDTHGFGKCE